MPVVGIPSLLRDLTNGQRLISVEGDTVRQVIENLEKLHPGIKERLYDGDRLRSSIAVVVTNGVKLTLEVATSNCCGEQADDKTMNDKRGRLK